jgi:hypothetical protein
VVKPNQKNFWFSKFSVLEYLLWRAHTSGQRVHGYGITLKGEADKEWRINKFHPDANVKESFTIIDGQDHTG